MGSFGRSQRARLTGVPPGGRGRRGAPGRSEPGTRRPPSTPEPLVGWRTRLLDEGVVDQLLGGRLHLELIEPAPDVEGVLDDPGEIAWLGCRPEELLVARLVVELDALQDLGEDLGIL